MNKILSLVATIVVASNGFAFATNMQEKPLVSIDSIAIMQRSTEGQELTNKIQKEIEAFQSDVKNTQKDLTDQQEALTKQAKVLSKDMVVEKTEELNQKKKKLEREFADKEEALRLSIQKKQIALRDKQLVIINEVFEKEGWGLLIDKNTPGVLCVSNAIDKTDAVLKAVDEKYQSPAKSKATIKTAARDTTQTQNQTQKVKVA